MKKTAHFHACSGRSDVGEAPSAHEASRRPPSPEAAKAAGSLSPKGETN